MSFRIFPLISGKRLNHRFAGWVWRVRLKSGFGLWEKEPEGIWEVQGE
jgi:hypothetical protein